MADFDRAIRNRRVATAADAVTCDFGVGAEGKALSITPFTSSSAIPRSR